MSLVKHSFSVEGQITYMNDDIGLHKVGNPNKDVGSVTLHLYTPPFGSCKVWRDEAAPLDDFDIGKIGFFSCFGHRSPHLEGRPGNHSLLLHEIRSSVISRVACVSEKRSA
jgi:Cysteine dioxygenase type I